MLSNCVSSKGRTSGVSIAVRWLGEAEVRDSAALRLLDNLFPPYFSAQNSDKATGQRLAADDTEEEARAAAFNTVTKGRRRRTKERLYYQALKHSGSKRA